MKKPIEKGICSMCPKILPIKKLYKMTWRYQDKERHYQHSKVKIIHTGYQHYCKKCLTKALNILKGNK